MSDKMMGNPLEGIGDFSGGGIPADGMGNLPGGGGGNPMDKAGGGADAAQAVLGGFMGGNPPELPRVLSLRSFHKKYLSAQPQGTAECNRDVSGQWEEIAAEPLGAGKVALQSCHNRYLSALPNGALAWDREKALEWETWTVEQVCSK